MRARLYHRDQQGRPYHLDPQRFAVEAMLGEMEIDCNCSHFKLPAVSDSGPAAPG